MTAIVRVLGVVVTAGLAPAVPATASTPEGNAVEPDDELTIAEPAQAPFDAESIAERLEAMGSTPDEQTLREVLADVRTHPFEVAKSPGAHEARMRALLWLAAMHLGSDRDAAIAAIDEAIRIARGAVLPTLGHRDVDRLATERLGAPENVPLGELMVRCDEPCWVVLDERSAGEGAEVVTRGIPLGPHRLHIRDADEPSLATQDTIVLTREQPEHIATLSHPTAPTPVLDASPPQDPVAPERKLPRWAGIVGTSVGVAAMIAGATLLAFDGRCPNGDDPSTRCGNVLDTQNAGIGLTVAGAALTVGFAIPLGIGESRARRRRELGRASTPAQP